MRIEWELKDFLVPQEKVEDYFDTLYAQKYDMSFRPLLLGCKTSHGDLCIENVSLLV